MHRVAQVLFASILVLLNAWIVLGVVGVVYGPFDWTAFAGIYMGRETDVPGGCSDGIDNDGDGQIDCGDVDCRAEPACATQAPIMGPPGVALTVLVLMLIAAVALRRRPASAAVEDR